jgi:diguanylate cyclase (GGDEF)-like protein
MNQSVLIIDDSKVIHGFVKMHLANDPIDLHSAYGGETGLSMATALHPDLILLDVTMPPPDGMQVCRYLKAKAETMAIPVIFLTGASTTEEKIAGLELGAVDYITKPFDPAELRARVRASLRTKFLLDLLAKRAMIDGLTGLWNRTHLEQQLKIQLAASRRSGRPFSCVMTDIDHFKSINDRFGHPFGDDVLRATAQILLNQCRTEDLVYRYGGEEFVILSADIDIHGAIALAERLRAAVESELRSCGGKEAGVTCSFGVAQAEASFLVSPIGLADEGLYRAKRRGRNRVISVQSAGCETMPGTMPETMLGAMSGAMFDTMSRAG